LSILLQVVFELYHTRVMGHTLCFFFITIVTFLPRNRLRNIWKPRIHISICSLWISDRWIYRRHLNYSGICTLHPGTCIIHYSTAFGFCITSIRNSLSGATMISFLLLRIRRNVNSSSGSSDVTSIDAFSVSCDMSAACAFDCSSDKDECTIAPA